MEFTGSDYVRITLTRGKQSSLTKLKTAISLNHFEQGVGKMDFKEGAIYQLPNGRELIAHSTRESKPVLYNLSASDAGMYELNSEGRLLFNGQLTAWEVGDLLETGRNASPDLDALLVKPSSTEGEIANEQSARTNSGA
jgi:hypothetical protein